MRRLAGLLLVAAAVAAVLASSAGAALFFLFQPTAATPGDRVTVRTGGTPAGFTLRQRKRPLQKPIRVYLVPNRLAGEVRGRFDPRLHFVGVLVPDRDARGVLTFTVPPLDSDTYVAAAWCPGCARYSRGRSFFVFAQPAVSRDRKQMALRVQLPDPTAECPVTLPTSRSSQGFTHGNGLLSSTVPLDGVVTGAHYEPDGSVSWKPGWRPANGFRFAGPLTVKGERLDAPSPPMRVLAVRWGTGNSWRTASTFPSEGCWRITGRVDDIALSYVVKVVAG